MDDKVFMGCVEHTVLFHIHDAKAYTGHKNAVFSAWTLFQSALSLLNQIEKK